MFREDDIIILIGAGCSADAGIPTSTQMISKVEQLLEREWKEFKKIYYFMKSSIQYADGIKGYFNVNLDIERLVSVLSELEKKENSILFPFIGSWNPRLLELAGYDFRIISNFKEEILKKLITWIQLDNYIKASYYKNFFRFQKEYNFPLRIFSLNYDLCLEKNTPDDSDLERGFNDDKIWDWRKFEKSEEYEPNIYLYKLHGSIDWKRDEKEGNILKEVERIPDNPDLIFGTDYKLQYVDPYLFYAYELRKYSLETKIIITIGYSFRDEHINSILHQALKQDPDRKLIVVSKNTENIMKQFEDDIKKQIYPKDQKAKDFLDKISLEYIKEIVENDK